MKALVVSNILGSIDAVDLIKEVADREHVDLVLLLGNLFHADPRKDPPADYDPPYVLERLNDLRGRIIACRGDLDTAGDEAALKFLLPEVNEVYFNGRRLILTHGDRLVLQERALRPTDIVLIGEGTLPMIRQTSSGVIVVDPGSLTFSRLSEGLMSYAVIREDEIRLHDENGLLLKLLKLI